MEQPNVRIAEKYRQLIRDGVLTAGTRLPAVREMSREEGVATATVRNALSWLRIEGFIVTTQRGSFVAEAPSVAASPRDRIGRVQRTGSVMADGETKRVLAADLVVPPLYVAELYDVDPRAQVVRREYVTISGPRVTSLCVDWLPAWAVELVPDVLATFPGERTDDLVARLAAATERPLTFGSDAMHARTADVREANRLGVEVGCAILAGAHEWSDAEGVVVYGEWCLPPRVTVRYEYPL